MIKVPTPLHTCLPPPKLAPRRAAAPPAIRRTTTIVGPQGQEGGATKPRVLRGLNGNTPFIKPHVIVVDGDSSDDSSDDSSVESSDESSDESTDDNSNEGEEVKSND